MKTVTRVTSTDLPGIYSTDGDSECALPHHNRFASDPINLISTTDPKKSQTSSADTCIYIVVVLENAQLRVTNVPTNMLNSLCMELDFYCVMTSKHQFLWES